MNESRNLILAVVLSAIVLLGWTLISDRFLPTANPTPQVYKGGKEIVKAEPQADPTADGATAVRDRKLVLAETPRVVIDTPRLAGSINLKGARIDDLLLKDYHETIAKGSPNIRLFSPSGAPEAYFAQVGWSGAGAPPADAVWAASSTRLTPAAPVTLSWKSPAGALFEIVLAIDQDYLFTATQRVSNSSGAALTVQPYGLVSRAGPSKDPSTWTNHVGPMGVLNDRANYKINFKDLVEGNQTYQSQGGWAGFTDKYWLTALIAADGAPIAANFRHAAAGDRFQTDLAGKRQAVAPGASAQSVTRLFAGAKEVPLLDHYRTSQGIQQFDKAIDWGWFYPLPKIFFYVLDYIFKAVGNFGLAIMGLTLIVKLVMFPIANKQFASMARMRVLQPKLKALQERHKDDKARQQQEVMALYAKEKVNPLGGCLPIVIQIPVFYSLYKVLMLTIEMRHQPFVAWIKDLSAPDPLTPVNLFGLLPFTPPHMLSLGVLAILLGVTMWIQQKLNPAPLDPAQAQVMGLMPWVFMFVMASFASGLQLYWITNNLLSIAQQKALMARHPRPGDDVTEDDIAAADRIEAARKLFAGPIAFLKSAPALEFLPDPDVPEVAFAGRSNVGKSSLLNMLTGRTGLARTSNTPGRTQELNLFDVGEPLVMRLVDMPGYGFAEAPKDVVRKWKFLVNDYLRGRPNLKRVLLLIDGRHGLKPVDREIMGLMDKAAVSYQLVLTKADKLKPTEFAGIMAATSDVARTHPAAYPDLLETSSTDKRGLELLRAAVLAAVE